MADSSVIDPQAIENLRALDPGDNGEFLREITGIFFQDTPQRIAELDQSLLSGDLARFTRAAHSIKGSSSNLGAMALRSAAEKLEHAARLHGLNDVAGLLADVKNEFTRAQTALTTLIAK